MFVAALDEFIYVMNLGVVEVDVVLGQAIWGEGRWIDTHVASHDLRDHRVGDQNSLPFIFFVVKLL